MNALNSLNALNVWSEPMVRRLGWTLVHSLWQGVVIAAALLAVLRLMRSAPANLRYVTSCVALAMFVIAGAATFAVIGITPGDQSDALMKMSAADSIAKPRAAKLLPTMATALPPAALPFATAEPAHAELRWLVLAWAIGVIAISLWHIGGWIWLTRMRRGRPLEQWETSLHRLSKRIGIRRAVRLIETARIDVPAVVGALRPVILVPIGVFSGLSPQQVEAILAHELAHVRRHDYLVNLIQSAIETVMFYHPATWWISAQIRAERENCCDDIASAACGDERAYASALAALEERRGRGAIAAPGIAIAATGGNLLDRVRRVLHLPPVQRVSRVHSLAATALAIACVAVPVACVSVPATARGDQKSAAKEPASAPATASAAATSQATPIRPEDLEAKVDDYRTGPADLLSVSINELAGPGKETVKTARVSDTGVISLPYIGVIKVAGLTVPEMEKAISKAYLDKSVLQNAQVSVTISEARQRTFNILGDVEHPGVYQISTSDFRLLDALTTGGMRSSKPSDLHVIRSEQGKQRTINIPADALAAGDAHVNIVIRPGDTIMVAAAPQKFLKIVIGKQSLFYQDKPVELADVSKLFEAMSEPERRGVVLEVAVAAPDVTVERYFDQSAHLAELVKRFHLAYLSQTGIQPTTEPAAGAGGTEVGEYYVSGVKRAGVYSLTGRKITLKQALIAAGGPEAMARMAKVTVIRREGDVEKPAARDIPVEDLTEGRVKDIYLRANDIVLVKPESELAAMEMGQLMNQRDAVAAELIQAKKKFGAQNPRILQIDEILKSLDERIAERGEGWKPTTKISTTQP